MPEPRPGVLQGARPDARAEGVVASAALRGVLQGPERTVRAVAASEAAVHFAVDAPVGVLSVVARDAVEFPGALVLPRPRADRPLGGRRVGEAAVVGAGRLVLGDRVLVPRRWVDPRVRRWCADAPTLARAATRLAEGAARVPPAPDPLLPDLAARLATVVGALAAGDVTRACGDAAGLLGRGRGFTPAGDDALAGLLLGLAVVDVGAIDEVATRVRARFAHLTLARAADATGRVPAALLGHAARGEAAAPVRALLRALARDGGDGRGSPDAVDGALAAVLTLGHSSGHDLVAGLVAALELLAGLRGSDDPAGVASVEDARRASRAAVGGPR